MNENLNLVEILKDCPKGTKLYSTVWGNVYFNEVNDTTEYPISVISADNFISRSLTSDGRLWANYKGECILFPSRDQRDWEKFIPPYKFKDGDIVATLSGLHVFILKREEVSGTGYCYIGYNFRDNTLFPAGECSFIRLATEEEKRKFFDAIKENGYKWNAETKTLEKLVKLRFKVGDKIVNIPRKYMGASRTHIISEITDGKYICTDCSYISISDQDSWELVPDRFDPKTLKPFDKILVRRSNENYNVWFPDFVSDPPNDTSNKTMCMCIMEDIAMVIPYNDDTKHLVSTAEEAPEYYRYWED